MQRNTVLDRMVELKKITAAQAEAGQAGEGHVESEAAAADPGELRDGRGPAGFESAPHAGPDR